MLRSAVRLAGACHHHGLCGHLLTAVQAHAERPIALAQHGLHSGTSAKGSFWQRCGQLLGNGLHAGGGHHGAAFGQHLHGESAHCRAGLQRGVQKDTAEERTQKALYEARRIVALLHIHQAGPTGG